MQSLPKDTVTCSLRVVNTGEFVVSTDLPVSFLRPIICALQGTPISVVTPIEDEWVNPACVKFDITMRPKNGPHSTGIKKVLVTRSGTYVCESYSDGSLLLASENICTARVAGCFVAPGQVCRHGLVSGIVGDPTKTLAVSFDSNHVRLTKNSRATDVTRVRGKATLSDFIVTPEIMRDRNVCFTYTNSIAFAKPIRFISLLPNDCSVLLVVTEGNLIHVFDIGETPQAAPHAVSLRQTFVLSCVDRTDPKERIGGIHMLEKTNTCAVLICGNKNNTAYNDYATQNQVVMIINFRTGLVEHIVTSSFIERSACIPNRFDVFYDGKGEQKILFIHENGLCTVDPMDPNNPAKSQLKKHPLACVMNRWQPWMIPSSKMTIFNTCPDTHVFAATMYRNRTVRILMLDLGENARNQTDHTRLDFIPVREEQFAQPHIFVFPENGRIQIRGNDFLTRSGFLSVHMTAVIKRSGLKSFEPWTPLRHKFIKTAVTGRIIFRLVCIKEWMEKHHHSSIPRLPIEIWLLVFYAVHHSYCSSRTYKILPM